jgi:hypothetical protein
MNIEQELQFGTRILCGYWHHLNSRSRVWLTKSGMVMASNCGRRSHAGDCVIVLFDGNRIESHVSASGLEKAGDYKQSA